MRILNFGSCNVDIVYSMDHITAPGETNAASMLSYFPGGKGLNQSVALARAGAEVYHAGCIGEDGTMLEQTLKDAGVDLQYLKTVPEKTGHAVIQVDKHGENCIIIYHGANASVTGEQIDDVLSHFSSGDYVITQNEISNLPYLITAASQKGLHVVLNPSPCNSALKEIDLNRIRYLLLNEVEAELMFSSREPERIQSILLEQHPDLTVVLTLGKAGSVYIRKDQILVQSAFFVKIEDTTAAGDTFTGYFIAEISAGKTPQEAMRIASAAAALAVSRDGASSSIPAMAEVEAQLPVLKPISALKNNAKDE